MAKKPTKDLINGAMSDLDIGNGTSHTVHTTERPFSHLAFSYVIESLLTGETWDNVEATYSGTREVLTFKNNTTTVKTINIDYNGLGYTISEAADEFLVQQNGDFVLQQNGDRIIIRS